MITRLDGFLNEGRSVPITPEQLSKVDSLYDLKAPKVFRGVDDERPAIFTDPKQSVRKSKENSNHYTLWIDNNESWYEYPLRSKSIICATSPQTARRFANYIYSVWPMDPDTVFGMCPASDIWNSINMKFTGDSLENVSAVLTGTKYTQIATLPEVPEAVKKFAYGRLQHVPYIHVALNEYIMLLDMLKIDDSNYDMMVSDLKALNMYEFTDAVISPVGFRTITFKELLHDNWGLRELWTDAESALILCPKYSNLNDDAE